MVDETYDKYSELRDFFEITSYATSDTGDRFIASVEAKNYPITAV